jgi:hypothetical protein
MFVSVSDSVQPGEDQIRINDKVGSRLLEHRIVRQNEGGIWQMDLHKLGVYLPQDRCPWSDEYSVERKQFFYLMRSKKLVANVYCGNKGKNNYIWKKIGIIIAESN